MLPVVLESVGYCESVAVKSPSSPLSSPPISPISNLSPQCTITAPPSPLYGRILNTGLSAIDQNASIYLPDMLDAEGDPEDDAEIDQSLFVPLSPTEVMSPSEASDPNDDSFEPEDLKDAENVESPEPMFESVRATRKNGGKITKVSNASSRLKIPDHLRKRKAPKNPVAEKEIIPRSLDDLGPADKLLWEMRKKGHTYNEILPHYEALIGQKIASSTLPNRYSRLREFNVVFTDEDDEMLLKSKRIIEETFEQEKWEMVKEFMIARGGDRFTPKALAERYEIITNRNGEGESIYD